MYASDISLPGKIFVSYYAYHNHRSKVNELVSLVKRTLPEYRKLLDFGEVSIRIAPLKGSTTGRFWDSSKFVEIDSRLTPEKALETFAHELVHAEQYHTGKMNQTYVKGRWMRSWQGEVVRKGSTYAAYRATPWEVEAFGRQAELAETVRKAMSGQR